MNNYYDPDEWEPVIESHPCPCNGKCNGCCTGSFGISQRKRPWPDVLRIKAERREREEDEILAHADEIRRRRGIHDMK